MQLESLSPQGHALLALLGLMRHSMSPAGRYSAAAYDVAAKAQSTLYVRGLEYPEASDLYRFEDELQAIGEIARAVCS
jgi:hypothetical protein